MDNRLINVVFIGQGEGKEALAKLKKTNLINIIGVDYISYPIHLAIFRLCDTSGHKRFFNASTRLIENADAVILCNPTHQHREMVKDLHETHYIIDFDENIGLENHLMQIQEFVNIKNNAMESPPMENSCVSPRLFQQTESSPTHTDIQDVKNISESYNMV